MCTIAKSALYNLSCWCVDSQNLYSLFPSNLSALYFVLIHVSFYSWQGCWSRCQKAFRKRRLRQQGVEDCSRKNGSSWCKQHCVISTIICEHCIVSTTGDDPQECCLRRCQWRRTRIATRTIDRSARIFFHGSQKVRRLDGFSNVWALQTGLRWSRLVSKPWTKWEQTQEANQTFLCNAGVCVYSRPTLGDFGSIALCEPRWRREWGSNSDPKYDAGLFLKHWRNAVHRFWSGT